MIAKTIAIVRPDQLDLINTTKLIDEFYGISIDYNLFVHEHTPHLLDLLFRKKINFCFTLNFSEEHASLTQAELERFYFNAMLYFLSINYIKIRRNPLINIIVNDANQIAIHDVVSLAKKEILAQGFKDIEIAFFNANTHSNFRETAQPFYYYDLNSKIDLPNKQLILNSYLNGYMTNKHFFLNALQLKNFNQNSFSIVTEIESKLREENVLLNNALLGTKRIITETEELHQENILFQQRIEINNEFMSLLRSSSISNAVQLTKEKEEIISWYQKEYEALPLWYKRLGHIVKVLYGKRSLKSILKK
ncbi:MAG TPA: hypothetical protein VLB84_01700 [Bacteroidia bacterium]|jgi:hypothetical protein|nr:hypothetical protein [Bacteroidia bacterium]